MSERKDSLPEQELVAQEPEAKTDESEQAKTDESEESKEKNSPDKDAHAQAEDTEKLEDEVEILEGDVELVEEELKLPDQPKKGPPKPPADALPKPLRLKRGKPKPLGRIPPKPQIGDILKSTKTERDEPEDKQEKKDKDGDKLEDERKVEDVVAEAIAEDSEIGKVEDDKKDADENKNKSEAERKKKALKTTAARERQKNLAVLEERGSGSISISRASSSGPSIVNDSPTGSSIISIPPPPLKEEKVGRYDVVYPFAQGGMASVYVGRLSGMAGFERLVAIKVIHPHLACQESFVKMFLDEARLAARIHHPNVGEIVEVGQEGDLFFMIGELIIGQNLRTFFKRARKQGIDISAAMSAKIASQVCQGLHAAHELTDQDGTALGLVHRDVSPRNILISYGGFVKLIDFGVALARDRITQTDVGTLKGKIGYMSPEQIRGEEIDRRSDVFALGIVLYQMITGKHPFPGGGEIDRIHKIMSGSFAPPDEIVEDLDPKLKGIIMKAMAGAPEDRYDTAMQMSDDLEEYLKAADANVATAALSQLMDSLFADEQTYHQERLRAYREQDSGQFANAAIPRIDGTGSVARPPTEGQTRMEMSEAATPLSVQMELAKQRRRRFLFIAAGAFVAVLAFGIISLTSVFRPKDPPGLASPQPPQIEQPPTIEEKPVAPAPAEEPHMVIQKPKKIRIDLVVSPEDATIKFDGAVLDPGVKHLDLTGDGTAHVISVSQKGYQRHLKTIVADADKTLTFSLEKIKIQKKRKKKGKSRKVEGSGELKGSPYS